MLRATQQKNSAPLVDNQHSRVRKRAAEDVAFHGAFFGSFADHLLAGLWTAAAWRTASSPEVALPAEDAVVRGQ